MAINFRPPLDAAAQDETAELRPNFNREGLVAAIAQDAETDEVLMLAWMNAEALAATLETGTATYWSRSRAELWIKGETSGNTQTLVEARTDCDQDAILIRVHQKGGACHTNRKSCFYREIDGERLSITNESG